MDTRTDESEQQLNEMHTLQRQLDEQLAESLSRVSEGSQLPAKETWCDEIGSQRRCVSECRLREVLSESEQSSRPGKTKETAKAHQ